MSRSFTKKELEQLLTDGWRQDEDYVFVSYASADWEKVYPTVLALRAKGINVYIDVEFQENQSQNWLENFQERLLEDPFCKGIVTFLSINYMRSYACLMEQLANRTQRMYSIAMEFHPVFYIALEPEMGSVQSMASYLKKCRKESVMHSVTVTAAEYSVLQDFIADMHEDYGTYSIEDAAKKVKMLKNKHHVAITMYELIFQKNTPSIQGFDRPEECAEVLYRNFVNEKNTTIELKALEELGSKTRQKLREAGYVFERETEPAAPKESLSEPRPGTAPEDASVVPQQKGPSSPESVIASAESGSAQKEPDGKENRQTEAEDDPADEKTQEKDRNLENPEGRKSKPHTTTGDITFTLYGKEHTYNQSDMMLTFFAQVLNRHQEYVEGLPERKGMNCASAVDYTKEANRTGEMPPYFRVCQYFEFSSGCGVCIGTAYGINDKLKKMAMLLDICGEDPSVFSSEQVELPAPGNAKNTATVIYKIYGKSFSSSQTEMMGNIFREVIECHPDKLSELADQLTCVAISDYGKVPKKQRPVYFTSLCVYDLKGVTYSIGGTFSMADKLKQIVKLLDICEVDKSEVEIEGYELPGAGKRKKSNISYF